LQPQGAATGLKCPFELVVEQGDVALLADVLQEVRCGL
jgi:hypothetical protein